MWDEEDMLYSYSGEDMIISDESITSDEDDFMPDVYDEISDEEDDNYNFNARRIYYDPNIPLIDVMFPEFAPQYFDNSF